MNLVSFRVLDLTEEGSFCGKILADLGADVVKVEAPGGDRSRRAGPLGGGERGELASTSWLFNNSNKRGITLDIETADGRQILRQLAKKFDVLIESFPPGYLDRLEIGYRDLSTINPGLIFVSITPFGQTGPYREHKGTDLTLLARGGMLVMIGEPESAPLRPSVPQSYLHAGAEAATATMIAYYYREQTGKGQWVDVSAQHSLFVTMANAIPMWELSQTLLPRSGVFRGGTAGQPLRTHWPCADGYVCFAVQGGVRGGPWTSELVKWMAEEGLADDFILSIDWLEFDMASLTQETIERIERSIGEFFLAHTKAVLYEGALERRITLVPILSMKELLGSPQLEARSFWSNVDHPELGRSLVYPGNFLLSRDGTRDPVRRAPVHGEHNEEVYGKELGMTPEQIAALKSLNVI